MVPIRGQLAVVADLELIRVMAGLAIRTRAERNWKKCLALEGRLGSPDGAGHDDVVAVTPTGIGSSTPLPILGSSARRLALLSPLPTGRKFRVNKRLSALDRKMW